MVEVRALPPRRVSTIYDAGRLRVRHRVDLAGRYRIFNATEYRFYRSKAPDPPPVEGDTPYQTSPSLPYTDSPSPVWSDGTWYLAMSYFDGVIDSGFLPLGPYGRTYTRMDIALSELAGRPPAQVEGSPTSAPSEWHLVTAAGGGVVIQGLYYEQVAATRAQQWALKFTFDGTTPTEMVNDGDEDLLVTMGTSGIEVLVHPLAAQAHGTTVKVRLQTRREQFPDVFYSEGSTVQTITADAQGPSAPYTATKWPGRLPEDAV